VRRADRLFQLVGLLRRRRFVTARQLAEVLEVSERTVYRDVRDLVARGVPIDGEAGVGYRMAEGFELPPLAFTLEEVQALVLGVRMVRRWADDDLGRAARQVLDKVDAALPESSRTQLAKTALFTPRFSLDVRVARHLRRARAAIDGQQKLALAYEDGAGQRTERIICPLALYFWGPTWSLGAWCELRQDHRNFRLDRLQAMTPTGERFDLVSPVTLEDLVAAVTRERCGAPSTDP
jgi:predicted DNA-binding transcriptional regulator YafY